MLVECVLKGVLFLLCGLLLTEAAPRHKFEVRHSQVCGDKLANIMALVCSGRGYYSAFRAERNTTQRFRRGIVEECCRKSCSPAMLDLYCQEPTTEDPSTVPIRKRSQTLESTELHQMEEMPLSKHITFDTEASNIPIQENKTESTTTTTTKEGEGNYRLLNLLVPPHKKDTRTSNKVTPNETTEEELFIEHHPPMRHKHHRHHGMRQFHSRKASSKTKKAKDISGEASFEIGLTKPYFAPYRKNYVDQTDLS